MYNAGSDPEQRKLIEIEQEAWRSVNALFRKKERELKIELAKEKLEKEQEKQRVLKAIEKLRSFGASDTEIEQTLNISLKDYLS